ncbi:PD-(D/E)XK nuclease family protein [Enterococcus durans]|uniref:PDDEXK-like family protein n=1 Tax=Enterococcus durans TaxID=53345 RepID=UPI0022E89962|nr:PD-(D/E)XK nuclease family protein [Enterococcus durans]
MIDEKKCLKNLLEDIDDIEERLSKWTGKTNIFQILKISKNEIRHSNFLAFLFAPNETHNLSDEFFKMFLKRYIDSNDDTKAAINYFDALLNSYEDLIVYRENKNIDILLVSEKNKIVVCIENKILSSESRGQLNKYQRYIERNYSNYKKIFVFLTPDGNEPTNPNWGIITYKDIVEILEQLMQKNSMEKKVYYLIKDYVDILRRDVGMDDEIKEIVRKIYQQHKEALDLIFENIPDNLSLMSELYIEALEQIAKENEIIFDPKYSGKSIVRFQIPEFTDLFPDLPLSHPGGWSNHKMYAFEILNKGGNSVGKIKLVFTGKIPEENKKFVEELMLTTGVKMKKENWEWWNVAEWKINKVNMRFIEDLYTKLENEGRDQVVKEIKKSLEKNLKDIKEKAREYEKIKNNFYTERI